MPRRGVVRVASAPLQALPIALLVVLTVQPAQAEPRATAFVASVTTAAKPKAPPVARLAASADDKRREPKPPSDPPRFKPDSSGTGGGSSSEDGTSACVADCLVNVFSLICSALDSWSSSSGTSRAVGAAWAVGDQARLTANLADSVTLFGWPGGGDLARVRLAQGERVVVLETAVRSDGTWIRVRPEDRLEPVGWVHDASAVRMGAVTRPEPARPPGHAGGGIRIAAGGSGVGPSELNLEYRNGGYRASAEVLRFLTQRWAWGAGVGYRNANGAPQVVYLTPTTVEEPLDSRFWMLDVGVRGGQRYGWGSGFRFDWLLGPALSYVHESCDLRISDATTGALIVQRKEALGRWAAGGELRLGFGHALSGGSELTLVSGVHVLAWRGRGERSLSTDFVNGSIHGFDVALGLTFPTR